MAACVCAPNIRQLADKKSTLNKKLDQFPLALLLYSFHTTKRAKKESTYLYIFSILKCPKQILYVTQKKGRAKP